MKVNLKSIWPPLAVLSLVIMFVPWNTSVVPAVRVLVFDVAGKPAAGIRVEQTWEYTALESYSQRAVLATDADGYAVLPKRSIRVSLARKSIGFVMSFAPVMCASGFGPSGSISASDSHTSDIVVCDVNNPVPRPLKLTPDLVAH